MAKIDWKSLVTTLNKMTEEEVKSLLDDEIEKHRRPAFARRLHQRYSALRTLRERAVIMEGLAK